VRGIVVLSVFVPVLYLTWRFGGMYAGKLAATTEGESGAAWLVCIGAAALWPLALVLFAYYWAMNYRRAGPHDPGDAPGYVLMGAIVLGGFFFVLGLAISGIFSLMTYRRLKRQSQ
jgi:hypothetical protein